MANRNALSLEFDDPTWYKDAVIYQLHVRAFYDSNGDGIGDFPGLIQKLDYLASLGVTALWLQPFYPSPLRDDGYDIANYEDINPMYGSLADFQRFLYEAHKRNLKIITELVINHTSDQHVWFQKSRRAPEDSYWRDFYVWSEDPNKYKGTRIIFKDFETSNWAWDPVAKSYYWHRFYSHQPDLNFDNPEVQNAIFKVMDFWMEMGVDGMRLDAVPYLYERENTSCENLPETHAFLKKMRAHLEKKFPGRMLLAEANQWPEDAIAYFGEGDECHMNFHFPLMPRLFMALKMEDRYSILDILKQTPEVPENCQWAIFLRNHDELTLEMVTDEERDYMYKVYASDPRARINLGVRRRLAPLTGNDRRQIELLNSLLFSLPGSPVIYYGDEIGMGDNIYLGDRDGVRTPFQWSADRNAGFSRANPQSLYLPVISSSEYSSETVNVENAQANPNSLYWWMNKLIALRQTYPELSRGKLEFLESDNPKVLTYMRYHNGKAVICVVNLSRNAQHVNVDLSRFKGAVPTELLGLTDFPVVTDRPYTLSLIGYSFFWFSIEEPDGKKQGEKLGLSALRVGEAPLSEFIETKPWRSFERLLRPYLSRSRWFAGKGRRISTIELEDLFLMDSETHPSKDKEMALVLIRVHYSEGLPETYLLPIGYAKAEETAKELDPKSIIAESLDGGYFFEAMQEATFNSALLRQIIQKQERKGYRGLLTSDFQGEIPEELPTPNLSGKEQSNSAVYFDKAFFLKIYRRLEEGENPDIEIGKLLSQQKFEATAPYLGSLSYQMGSKKISLGILQKQIENESDGWTLMLGQLGQISERILTEKLLDNSELLSVLDLTKVKEARPPEEFQFVAGYTFQLASQLGVKTAEMHLALGSEDSPPEFAPEVFTPFHQRSIFQSFRNLTDKVLSQLRQSMRSLAEENQRLATEVLKYEEEIFRRFSYIKDSNIDSYRIRIHGDYHLGQVLFTGEDFVVIDFEGEPIRSLGERRLKRTPLKDVAGMIRSFDYAAEFYQKKFLLREQDRNKLQPYLRSWAIWATFEYLNAYLSRLEGSKLLPSHMDQIGKLLQIYILEKALYEIGYELRHRPEWVDIPLRGVLNVLKGSF